MFALLIYFPVFQDIDRLPVQLWDESRNANNAIEMVQNGNYLIRHYNGAPDMWELNPPLLTWLQSASMKVFGYNEFALRFPISLAVILTIFILLKFFKKEFGTYLPGITASLVLLTSQGYIGVHIARSGDHDAVLILFLAAAMLNFYLYIKYFNQSKYLIYTTIFLILAVYTKSIAGLFFLPGFLVYTLIKGKIKAVFSDYRTYLSILSFLFVVGIYYFLREYNNPGYLNYVWNDQLFPRFNNTSENITYAHSGYFFYFINLFDWRFTYWLPFLLGAPIYLKLKGASQFRDIILLAFSCSITLLLILSTGTKHIWYDGPVFPLFSMITGVIIFLLYKNLQDTFKKVTKNQFPFAVHFLVIIFFWPYYSAINKVYKAKEEDTRLYNGLFIRHLEKENKAYLNYSMFFQGYNAPVEFYVKALNTDGKHNVRVLGDQIKHLNIHDTIMSCDWASYHILDKAFVLNTIESFEHCRMYVIEEIKE